CCRQEVIFCTINPERYCCPCSGPSEILSLKNNNIQRSYSCLKSLPIITPSHHGTDRWAFPNFSTSQTQILHRLSRRHCSRISKRLNSLQILTVRQRSTIPSSHCNFQAGHSAACHPFSG